MNYLNHTLKACGPLALALLLSACGEKTALVLASSDDAGSETQTSNSAQDPVQSTVTEEFSSAQPVANNDEAPAQESVTGGDPMVTLIAKTNNSLNSTGTQLEWSSENVLECQTSGAWEGPVTTSGVINLTHEAPGNHTYTISCRGNEGTAMAMVTVEVESTSLAWEAPNNNTDGTELTDLAGYNLYYGSESGQYSQVRAIANPSQTQLELPVEPGTYYLAMTAYDMTGNESELSNEITRVVN